MTGAGNPAAGDSVYGALEKLPVIEIVALGAALPALAHGAEAPGSVRRDASGRAIVLHFAPRRWLAVADSYSANPEPSGCRRDDCTVTDVTGKWEVVRVVGTRAARVLASSLDIAAVLADRECAAAMLFDCPTVVVRDDDGFTIWVRSSYRLALSAALQRQLVSC
jgi:heterotetrameric sarcosine oxidase gamma subunit